MDESERLLAREELIEPAPDFARRVMAAVANEPRFSAPLVFPWRRAALGAALGIGAALATLAAPGTRSAAESVLDAIDGAQRAMTPLALATTCAVLLFTAFLVQATVWLTRRQT